MQISRMILVAATLLSSCYKPTYTFDTDGGTGFRCHATDNPPCPDGLVCCVGTLCGEELLNSPTPNADGWCLPPPPPMDLTMTALSYWPFGGKSMYYPGEITPLQLTGIDPDTMQWRCKRDDGNPDPVESIRKMYEPNDYPDAAITLANPLPTDLPSTNLGSAYEICPDKSAPDVPDVDVFKFRIQEPTKIIAEIRYLVRQGDLDMAIFQLDTDPETGMKKPRLVDKDLSPKDNACIEKTLMPGIYYLVVRGSSSPEMPGKYWMNTYTARVFRVSASTYSCKPVDGGG